MVSTRSAITLSSVCAPVVRRSTADLRRRLHRRSVRRRSRSTQAQEGRCQNGEGVAFDILHILFLGYGRLGVQTAFKGWVV